MTFGVRVEQQVLFLFLQYNDVVVLVIVRFTGLLLDHPPHLDVETVLDARVGLPLSCMGWLHAISLQIGFHGQLVYMSF